MDAQQIYAIERPHPKLWTYYLIQSFMLPPISLLALLPLYFRYHTMRYKFDDEGISMKWGILFRREVNLTYRRIQDIHLTSGPIQRWLGLADIHIQTASGSAAAEMKIEGLLEFEAIRDYLYTRMRGYQRGRAAAPAQAPSPVSGGEGAPSPELAGVLREIQAEMAAARAALERVQPGQGGNPHV